ncbi:MAG: histidine phosphatase family protein [Phyllobacterium sp.]
MCSFLNRIVPALIAIAIVMIAGNFPAQATEAAWSKLGQGGFVLLIRSQQSVDSENPDDFAAGDCTTGDSLTDRGRQQAQRMGARIASRGIRVTKIFTSQWCSAVETARFTFRSPKSETLPSLNATAAGSSKEATQTDEVRKVISGFRGPGNLVLVTHGNNITALTGITPREGEAILVRSKPNGEELEISGRIIFH